MDVLISGASGLVGSELVTFLQAKYHRSRTLVRSRQAAGGDRIFWDVEAEQIDKAQLAGIDAVVHLAGENIGAGRWTAARKRRIKDSRVKGTRLLSRTLAELQQPPSVLVSASAVGYYGDRGAAVLDEDSPAGSGFLAEVCREWEAATQVAAASGIRVINLRFGVILTTKGGALKKMLPAFKLGVAGRIGSGQQYWSWITLDDVVSAIYHALTFDELRGPVNAVSPEPVTNREFTKILGKVLQRPTLFPLPAAVAKLVLGQMADEMLLASARVKPKKLTASGFRFRFIDLEAALRHLLK